MADAGRVIAGSARGLRLQGPGPMTRPMGDRVKQTLFAILEPDLREATVLDLYAGSGAAGIEALSRGAAAATFVERDPTALRTIRANLERTRLAGDRAHVIEGEVGRWLANRASGTFDIVVVDPPYDAPALVGTTLAALAPFVGPDARVVVKHATTTPPPERVGLLASERERRFGETTLTFYRHQEA